MSGDGARVHFVCAYKVITSCNQVSLSLSHAQDETNLIKALSEEGNLP